MGETGTAIFLSLFLVGGFSLVLAALAISNRPKKNSAKNSKRAA